MSTVQPCINCPVTPPLTVQSMPTGVEGKFCGGIAGIACPTGFICRLDGNYPDAGGRCVTE